MYKRQLLLLPSAFGMLLTNLLGSDIYHEELFAGGHVNWGLFGGAKMCIRDSSQGSSFRKRRQAS